MRPLISVFVLASALLFGCVPAADRGENDPRHRSLGAEPSSRFQTDSPLGSRTAAQRPAGDGESDADRAADERAVFPVGDEERNEPDY